MMRVVLMETSTCMYRKKATLVVESDYSYITKLESYITIVVDICWFSELVIVVLWASQV